MKKTLSLILALVMALGCMSITAFAEEDNTATITATVPAREIEYTMVIPSATSLDEDNHTDVLLGTDGKVSINVTANGTDKVNISYTADLTNGNLTNGETTITTTYKYKQGTNEFAAIESNSTKVTVYSGATVTDSFVNVSADETEWNKAPVGTYTGSITFNFVKEAAAPAINTIADVLNTIEFVSFKNQYDETVEIVGSELKFSAEGYQDHFAPDSYVSLPLTTAVTKSGDNYIYNMDNPGYEMVSVESILFTFVMENGKLIKMTISEEDLEYVPQS